MKAKLIRFGEIEIDGKRYTKDVVIEHGQIRKRDKQPSKALSAEYGHTPLSAAEAIPWECARLIVGSGVEGALPVLDDVRAQAEDKGIELIIAPTREACRLLSEADLDTTNAILHVTC